MEKINIKMILVGFVVVLSLVSVILFSKNNVDKQVNNLSAKEQEWLIFMREEEKLARDVYLTLGEKWGLQIFTNIAASEQTHTDAVKNLLDTYDIPDPVTNNEIGVFQSETLQKLYTDLVKKGEQSLIQALKVGAEIEDLDIRDLDIALSETNNQNILQVYANLQKGSRNHLRSFVGQLESRGEKYDSILTSEQEKGNKNTNMKNDTKNIDLVLDVRSVDEWNVGHGANAINIPVNELATRIAELSEYKNKNVVVVCRSGARASQAVEILKQSGFSSLENGGAWQNYR